jgi:glycosyltransferase involved in cell wall biosynthesis
MTLHDLRLLCPAIHMLRRGEVCERCHGGRFYEAVLGACVKGSRLASLLAAAETAHQRWRRLYQRHVQLFLCPSRFLREKFVAWGFPGPKLRHLPNFVDTSYWQPEPAVAGPEGDARADAYLYFGRISREKGLMTLLEAHALWETKARAAGSVEAVPELWIAGSGPQDAELAGAVAARGLKRINILGPLARPELRRRLARARFTVLPSEWYENAPMAVLESLAAGRPVVGTQLGGTPEMIVDGSTGILVPPRDPAALLAGLQRGWRLGREAETAARIWAERHARREEHMQRLKTILAEAAGLRR